MTALAARTRPASPAFEHPETVGPLGRLGRWTADHVRAVALAWAVVALALGAFAPKVESALSGAGWQANGSESVQARKLIQAHTSKELTFDYFDLLVVQYREVHGPIKGLYSDPRGLLVEPLISERKKMVHVRRDGFHCIAEVGYDVPVHRDEWVGVGFDLEHAMLFDASTGRTIN